MPLVVTNFIALGQTIYEKSVTKMFYSLRYFGVTGEPLGSKFNNLSPDVQQSPPINLSNFIDFVDGVIDKKQ